MQRCTVVCSDASHPVNSFLAEWQHSVRSEASVEIVRNVADAEEGDYLFLISCQEIVASSVASRFRHALVVHASDLPRGRGMSPHVWQILEGKDLVVVTLLNVAEPVDSGAIWSQISVHIPRNAVCAEINKLIFDAELRLMGWALRHCDAQQPRAQVGEPTYYRRRTPADSEVDPSKPLAEVFDQLRVADPGRYPAFFRLRDRVYRIRIEPVDP